MEKTCFVIIGFGKKTDPATGRLIDLDKTYDYIIKPVFEELKFLCFRSCDIKHSGVIDVPMYENILKADFVVADLSTLNANVLYELGIRHAVRKNTTIIISENELKYPFDLSHIVIEPYEHLGTAIDYGEVTRFRKVLKEKIEKLLSSPKVDSPLYTFFPSLEIPRFTEKEVQEIKENIKEDGSLSDLLSEAEVRKNKKDYLGAIQILSKAKSLNQDNVLVVQRLALVTYKSKQPDTIKALANAAKILDELKPETSTDIETLGLGGAINKRLYEELNDVAFLEKSIWFYERGFYLADDYYNGINLAFLFNAKACIADNKFEALGNFGNAIRIRKRVMQVCDTILTSKGWKERDDKIWVYLTLAECYFVREEFNQESTMIENVKKCAENEFALDSYKTQRNMLTTLIKKFKATYEL